MKSQAVETVMREYYPEKPPDTLFQGPPEKLPSLEEYHQARMSRVNFRQEALDTGNFTESEVDLVMRLIDAEANYWAKTTGKPATDWYLENIAGVRKWDLRATPGERALYQGDVGPIWAS